MKKSQAWTEEVTYVECPNCENLCTLGTDIVFTDPETEDHCQKCGCNFLIQEPK